MINIVGLIDTSQNGHCTNSDIAFILAPAIILQLTLTVGAVAALAAVSHGGGHGRGGLGHGGGHGRRHRRWTTQEGTSTGATTTAKVQVSAMTLRPTND